MLCIQTVELVLFYILIHNSAILQAIHTNCISKLSAIHADQNHQIDIKSCAYHVTKMAAEERAFKKTVRLIIPAGL